MTRERGYIQLKKTYNQLTTIKLDGFKSLLTKLRWVLCLVIFAFVRLENSWIYSCVAWLVWYVCTRPICLRFWNVPNIPNIQNHPKTSQNILQHPQNVPKQLKTPLKHPKCPKRPKTFQNVQKHPKTSQLQELEIGFLALLMYENTWPGHGPCLAETVQNSSRESFPGLIWECSAGKGRH